MSSRDLRQSVAAPVPRTYEEMCVGLPPVSLCVVSVQPPAYGSGVAGKESLLRPVHPHAHHRELHVLDYGQQGARVRVKLGR